MSERTLDPVHRPRLSAGMLDHNLVVVQAGAGYGKSTLAQQLADDGDLLPVVLRPDSAARGPRPVGRLVADALRRVGHLEAAAGLDSDHDLSTTADVLDGLPDDLLLVVDDVHVLGADELQDVAKLVELRAGAAPTLVIGRRVPDALLGSADVVVGSHALSFDLDETRRLADLSVHELDDTRVAELRLVTGGWAAGLASLLGRATLDLQRAPSTVAEQVHMVLEPLEQSDRERVSALAHLPYLHDDVVNALSARSALNRATGLGLPLRHLPRGQFEIADPFRDQLLAGSCLAPDDAVRAAGALAGIGEVPTAVRLLRGRADVAAAGLLARTTTDQLAGSHAREVLDLVDGLPDGALAEHPEVLSVASLLAVIVGDVERRRQLVDRLLRVGADTAPDLARAEQADLRAWLSQYEDAEALLEDDVDPATLAGRVAIAARARLLAREGDEREAIRLWSSLADASLRAGDRARAAYALVLRGATEEWSLGRYEQATASLREAARLTTSPTLRALALPFLAMVLVDCGRYEEASATIDEARAVGSAIGAPRRVAYACLAAARMASQRGDARATKSLVEEFESLGYADSAGGALLAADAAMLLDRVGLEDDADARLQPALNRIPDDRRHGWSALLVVSARRGDLDTARRAWDQLQDPDTEDLEERDRWRHVLMLAHVHRQADREDEAIELALRAFDDVASLGHPRLALVREPAIAAPLVEFAAAHGSAVARQLLSHGTAELDLLGEFRLRIGGRELEAPSGRPGELLGLVGTHGGRVRQDRAATVLWPEATPGVGRSRLRVVLARLRDSVGELVQRQGAFIVLSEGTQVDLVRVEALLDRALAGDLTAADAAVDAYAGPLLPHRDEPWVQETRQRLQQQLVVVLELLGADAQARGQLARTVHLLQQAVRLAPDDDGIHLALARVLVDQGRYRRAAAVLDRVLGRLEQQELTPHPDLLALRAALHRSG